ncbi:hypothetical protein Godav_009700, partial [Gossypium davidsonii]|nr:hypothetical protein [Gossypium davidsonii]
DNVSDPATAETIACLWAVNFAEDLGSREVSIEGDALAIGRKEGSKDSDNAQCVWDWWFLLKTAVAMRLVTVAGRLDIVAVRLETMVECVFGFKRSCSSE